MSSSPIALSTGTDSLGCVTHKLHASQDICADGIKVYRRRSDDTQLGHVATPASDRGHLVGISLKAGHRRRIFHGHHSALHDFGEGDVYVRGFADDYRADLRGPFDFLLVELSGHARGQQLAPITGQADPVLASLALALGCALEKPEQASRLFVAQMGTVIETYLFERYGRGPRTAPSPKPAQRLSRSHEDRAKEMLRSRLDGKLSIAEIADACALSRSHFIRTFRASTGQTPHQWLQAQRIEQARHLLRHSDMPIAEIATQCGFADQSHFTRVFTQLVGTTPARWRRALGN
jgi:AraC-like DNA-binding protein